jgi:dTDP-4-amino-4,6-dideoxygalactose transaminase
MATSSSGRKTGLPESIPLTRPSTDDAELAAVAEVLASGWLAGQGPKGRELEAGFMAVTGTSNAIAVNNCTAGLHLALGALGVGPGDEVVVADYSFPATAHAVLFRGATPVFADVRADTGTIDTELLSDVVTARTRGIIAVDALGVPADWDLLEAFASARQLFLVEDAACAVGGTFRGEPCGSFGDIAAFSLHARKGVTCGEGGVVTTNDDQLAAGVRRASCFGMTPAFERQNSAALDLPEFTELGYNYKLADVLAAIALVQLRKLSELLAKRRAAASYYAELLEGIPGVEAPSIPSDREATWQTYAVTVAPKVDRDRLAIGLRARGIGANIGTYSLHREPVYGSAREAAHCPTSMALLRQHLALPMYADLTRPQQERVVEELAALIDHATD